MPGLLRPILLAGAVTLGLGVPAHGTSIACGDWSTWTARAPDARDLPAEQHDYLLFDKFNWSLAEDPWFVFATRPGRRHAYSRAVPLTYIADPMFACGDEDLQTLERLQGCRAWWRGGQPHLNRGWLLRAANGRRRGSPPWMSERYDRPPFEKLDTVPEPPVPPANPAPFGPADGLYDDTRVGLERDDPALDAPVVPEPGTLSLAGIGLLLVGSAMRKRRASVFRSPRCVPRDCRL